MDRLDHLTERELIAFYRGELDADQSRRVVRHLLSGCETCRERSAGRWGTEVAARAGESNDRFDKIFNRAAGAALRLGKIIETEREAAPALLAELDGHPVERQKLMVGNSRRFRSFGLAERLLDAAFQNGFRDPRRAIEQSEIALAIIARLADTAYGARLVTDLEARAWGTLGNAQRIASRLREAERSIQRGLELTERGTGDPTERARLLGFLAGLRASQRRFDEALRFNEELLRIHESLGDRHMVGRAEVLKASILHRCGEPEKAIAAYERALEQLDGNREPRTQVVAQQGLATSLFQAGRLREAGERLSGLGRRFEAFGNELDALRCDWMEAKILNRTGEHRRAELRLDEVRDRFVELEIPYDAALASLDLAEALFDQGKTVEMSRRLGEAIAMFRALEIHRETIAALAFLKQATELEQVTAGLIRATARFVEESRQNPELRFRSRALKDS